MKLYGAARDFDGSVLLFEFLGLPWLHTWGSGRFSGVKRDAFYLADQIERYAHDL